MLLDLILVQIALPLAYYIRQKDFTLYGKDAYQTFIFLLVVAALVNFFFTENYKNILKRGFMKELMATLKYLLLNLSHHRKKSDLLKIYPLQGLHHLRQH